MPRSGDAQGEECRIPFIGPLKGERTPHTSFRRHSRPFGQAYAPSEVSGILFIKNLKISSLFLQLVLQNKDND